MNLHRGLLPLLLLTACAAGQDDDRSIRAGTEAFAPVYAVEAVAGSSSGYHTLGGSTTPLPGPTPSQPFAQSYTIHNPGGAPGTVRRYGDHLIVTQPGRLPATATPYGNGYVIHTPGRAPIIVKP